MSSQNRGLIHGILGPQSCGSRCWSVITAPASRSPTSSWATPTHFESLLRTSVGSVRQPPSLLTLPTSRKQVRPGARELGSVEAEELKRGGDLGHYVIGPLVPSATVCKTEGFAQRDFSEAPKFTHPLADCTTVTGYDTQLFCCVRGSPKVSGVPRAGHTALLPAPALTPTVWKCILTTPLFPSPPSARPTAGEAGYAQSGHAESKAGRCAGCFQFPFSRLFLVYEDVTY